jgi:hypothetical protein
MNVKTNEEAFNEKKKNFGSGLNWFTNGGRIGFYWLR